MNKESAGGEVEALRLVTSRELARRRQVSSANKFPHSPHQSWQKPHPLLPNLPWHSGHSGLMGSNESLSLLWIIAHTCTTPDLPHLRPSHQLAQKRRSAPAHIPDERARAFEHTIYTCAYTFTYTHAARIPPTPHARVDRHAKTHGHTKTHTRTRTHARTHARTHTHACTHKTHKDLLDISLALAQILHLSTEGEFRV